MEDQGCAPLSSSASASTLSFSPENHSWILVPPTSPVATHQPFTSPDESAEALVGIVPQCMLDEASGALIMGAPVADGSPDGAGLASVQVDAEDGGVLLAPPTQQSAPPSPLPSSSPRVMSESLLREGENVAALAVSEILSPECPLPAAAQPRSTAASDASFDGSCAEKPPAPTELSTPRKLGLLSFPPVLDALPPAKAPSEDDAAADDDAMELAVWWQGSPAISLCPWGRPLALVAVLLASHAAVLLLGVVIGRQQQAASADRGGDAMLIRRFSSGPQGIHARLAWP